MADFQTLGDGPPRTYVVVAAVDDPVVETLRVFARQQRLEAASFTAIGGFSRSTLAYFDVESKRYLDIPVDEQAEVLSLVGDIVRAPDGDWQVHAHAVLGLRDGSTRGGHLREAAVRPTLEVMVTESPAQVARRFDEHSGLALIELRDSSPVTDPDPVRHGLAP
ncbi:PPC domain-containing DNA-binding protein [Qaidamihabitans albus]|uniref:PPC domain-containing DNA-binding protein n=1 Tax=Qaidamihabitans albus TaxID=2795733 RepID=UPI0018F1C29A|nr:PPC domain-containing DNA-binding protein [Qaidamihabitans albus]